MKETAKGMKDLTKGSPFKLILFFALPVFLGCVFQQLYNMADTIIVGNTIGPDAFTGVGLTGSITFLVIGSMNGLTSGFSVKVAQAFGSGDEKRVRRAVGMSYLLSILVAVVVTAVAVPLTGVLLNLMQTPAMYYDYAYNYLFVIFCGIPATVFYNIVAGMVRAVGDSKTPLYFLICSAFLNIGLDFLFILVFKMFYTGAALAEAASFRQDGYLQKGKKALFCGKNLCTIHKNKLKIVAGIDCVLNCCHGMGGEDGALSSLLDLNGIPNASPDAAPSALFMDKTLTKLAAKALGVKTAPYFRIGEEEYRKRGAFALRVIEERLHYPVIVKPARQGSSIGIAVAEDRARLVAAIQAGFAYDDLLIVDKPAGMVVHPGHGNWDGTLVNALTYHLRTLPMFREGDLRAGLVHRIDKDTSGLLVVAKNERAHARLAKQFFDHTIVRRYYALVWGNPDADEGTIEGNIGRSPKDKLQMCVFADGEQGKHAVTHWRVVRRYGYVTLVECRLETGRTHQIRVHMAWKGFPLFNDARYGGARILKGTTFSKYRQFVENCFALLPRQALHARCLGFVHPSTGREVYFESELPADFRAVLDRWENYAAHVRTDAE